MSERPLQLMLVDEDPTFRLGLRVWLEQLPGFQIAAEAAKASEAMDILRKSDRTQDGENRYHNKQLDQRKTFL